jgi:TolB-like protein
MKGWTALAVALAAQAALAAAPRPKIAVMEVRAGQGLEAKQAAALTAILAADAARAGLDVISQSDIASMLAFQKQRQMLGCTDEGCLAEIGGALGADWVLSGEAARVGSRDHVTVVLIDPKKAAVAARNAGFSDAGDDALAMATQARFRAALATVLPGNVERMPPIDPPGAERLRARRTAAWWTLGAGGAVLLGGGAVGLVARSQANDLEAAWTASDYQDRYDTQRRTALTADLLMGAGAVTAGVGLWLFLTSDVPVVAVPIAADGAAGITLAGRF